jgi:hypothetical protein
MKQSKEVIIEFTRELYLTPNEQGNHKYSLRDICSEMLQKSYKNVTPITISRWAKKFSWDKLWEQAVKEGITKSIVGKIDKNKTLDEQYREAIAKRKERDFVIASSLKELGYSYIQANGFSSTTEALKAIDTGMKYTQDLSEVNPEGMVIKIIVESEDGKKMTEKILNGENT